MDHHTVIPLKKLFWMDKDQLYPDVLDELIAEMERLVNPMETVTLDGHQYIPTTWYTSLIVMLKEKQEAYTLYQHLMRVGGEIRDAKPIEVVGL